VGLFPKRFLNSMEKRPPWILPVIITTQFAGTSLWFAGNAILGDLRGLTWGMRMDMKQKIENLREEINRVLRDVFEEIMEDKIGVERHVYSEIRAFVLSGGKRIRPICMMMAYKGLGGKQRIVKTSLSIELIHNATLIHDDMMDKSLKRRGHDSFHIRMEKAFAMDCIIASPYFQPRLPETFHIPC